MVYRFIIQKRNACESSVKRSYKTRNYYGKKFEKSIAYFWCNVGHSFPVSSLCSDRDKYKVFCKEQILAFRQTLFNVSNGTNSESMKKSIISFAMRLFVPLFFDEKVLLHSDLWPPWINYTTFRFFFLLLLSRLTVAGGIRCIRTRNKRVRISATRNSPRAYAKQV